MTTFAERPSRLSDDGMLVEAYLNGDDDAFRELHDRHNRAVRLLLARRVRDYALAQDLAQETWARAVQYLRSFDTTRDFGPWIKRTAANVATEYGRRCAEVPTDLGDHPERALPDFAESVVLYDSVMTCLAELPSRQRRAIVMRYFEDRDAQVIASVLGISRNAVEQLLLRARLNFREGYGPRHATVPAFAALGARFRRFVDSVLARLNVATSATFSAAGDIAVGAAALAVGGLGLAHTMQPADARAADVPRFHVSAPATATDPVDALGARRESTVVHDYSAAPALVVDPHTAAAQDAGAAPADGAAATQADPAQGQQSPDSPIPDGPQAQPPTTGIARDVPIDEPDTTVEAKTDAGAADTGGEVFSGDAGIVADLPLDTEEGESPGEDADDDIGATIGVDVNIANNPACFPPLICVKT